MKDKDEILMALTISEAERAARENEVPVGALIALGDEVISKSYNQSIKNTDPTAHAEINAIKIAANKIGNYRLSECSIYVSLEPCVMCYGAIVQARIKRIIFSAYDSKTGACGSCLNFSNSQCFNHKPEIVGGVLMEKSSKILRDFFKERRI